MCAFRHRPAKVDCESSKDGLAQLRAMSQSTDQLLHKASSRTHAFGSERNTAYDAPIFQPATPARHPSRLTSATRSRVGRSAAQSNSRMDAATLAAGIKTGAVKPPVLAIKTEKQADMKSMVVAVANPKESLHIECAARAA